MAHHNCACATVGARPCRVADVSTNAAWNRKARGAAAVAGRHRHLIVWNFLIVDGVEFLILQYILKKNFGIFSYKDIYICVYIYHGGDFQVYSS